jgi:hypothetical protein
MPGAPHLAPFEMWVSGSRRVAHPSASLAEGGALDLSLSPQKSNARSRLRVGLQHLLGMLARGLR